MRMWARSIAAVSFLALFACAGPTPATPEPASVERAEPPDVTPAPAADVAGDVILANGFRIAGSVRGMTPDGLVRLASPLFVGEHAVRLGMLDRIHFGGTLPPAGQDVLRLTTGATLRGRIQAITADSVEFCSPSLGNVTVPKSAVSRMEWPHDGAALLSTDFTAGQIAPWDGYVVVGDRDIEATDIAIASRSRYGVRTRVEHEGRVTIEAEILRAPGAESLWQMWLFRPPQVRNGRPALPTENAFIASLSNRELKITPVTGDAPVHTKLPGKRKGKGEPTRYRLRISYDAGRERICAWVNGKMSREIALKKLLPTGLVIRIVAGKGWGLQRISVTRGALGPVRETDAPGADAQALVATYDGARIEAATLTMRDGRLEIGTTDGPLAISRKDVGAIIFGRVKRSTKSTGQATVDMTDGSLTLKPTQMTATHLLGTSATLGPMRIRRAAIRALLVGGSIVGQTGEDVAILTDGRKIVCRALSVDGERRLHFRAPWLDGEGVLSGNALKELHLAAAARESGGRDVARLTNGDVLTGKMLELTQEELHFQSELFGDLTLPVAIVDELSRREAVAKVLGDVADFSSGQWGPWKPYIGRWSVDKRGRLTSRGPVGRTSHADAPVLAARVDQSKGVTVEVEMDAAAQGFFYYRIVLLADALNCQWGNECIKVALHRTGVHVTTLRRNKSKRCVKYDYESRDMLKESHTLFDTSTNLPRGKLRVAYDPKTALLVIWFNGKQIGKCVIDHVPKGNPYVIISHGPGPGTRRASILPRFVPPAKIDPQPLAEDAFRLLLANGDTVDARSATVREGVVTLMAADGEMRLPLGRVARFTFPTISRKAPPSSGHDAVIRTESGPLSFSFTALTPEHVVGRSVLLGAVKLPRRLVRSLEFPARASASVSPR